jgi:hypothetical protein
VLVHKVYSNLLYCGANADGHLQWCCDNQEGIGTSCCNDTNPEYAINNFVGTYWFRPDGGQSLGESSSSASSDAPTNTKGPAATSIISDAPTSTSVPSNLSTTIGASIGVPLSVLAIGSLVFLFWRQGRKTSKSQREWASEEHGSHGVRTGSSWPSLSSASKIAASERSMFRPYPGPNGVSSGWHELSHERSLYELSHQRDPQELNLPSPRELDASRGSAR